MDILVVSVHPDDETLGCGGTILKHVAAKDNIYWLILTDAVNSSKFDAEFINKRQKQIQAVSQMYNFKKTYNLGFPTTELHKIDINEIIKSVSSVISEVKPQIIYTVNRSDVHTDHQIAAKVVSSCTKGFRYPFIKRVLMYECISETEFAQPFPENAFIPNAFCDISEYIEKKIEIMKNYESEVQDAPFPRSVENIKALARFRGAMIGAYYAEAFMLLRDIF